MKYITVASTDLGTLAVSVNNRIELGYAPSGPLVVMGCKFIQPMILKEVKDV